MDDLRQGVTPAQQALLDLYDAKASSLRHDFLIPGHLVVARERLKKAGDPNSALSMKENITRAVIHLLMALEKLDGEAGA